MQVLLGCAPRVVVPSMTFKMKHCATTLFQSRIDEKTSISTFLKASTSVLDGRCGFALFSGHCVSNEQALDSRNDDRRVGRL